MRRTRIILQARTSSQRLPAKVLLPIAGIPLALLCAQRLANRGREVVLATSDDPSDDILAGLAEDRNLKVHRGSLDNVAQRFLAASADMADDDLLIRATADNPVPDGALVEAVLADLAEAGAYVGPRCYRSPLPTGLVVEAFRLGALRQSLAGGIDAEVAEHVTPRLAAAAPRIEGAGFGPEAAVGTVRMTVDTFDDYLVAARAFRREPAGAEAPWRALVKRFAALRGGAEASG
jgi:spore coat polysaccharide biosynthesis protein SpsF (cytidylyltransferase family)